MVCRMPERQRSHRVADSAPSIQVKIQVKIQAQAAGILCFTSIQAALAMQERTIMTRLFYQPVDLSKVSTLIYHLPDGPALSVEMDGSDIFFDLEMEFGDICDTTDIDGVLHFFPKGNA